MSRPSAGLCFLALLLRGAGVIAGEDGFVPIDPASLEQVDGRLLVIAAYAAILVLVAAYALLLLLREGSLRRRARALERRLESAMAGDGGERGPRPMSR